MNRPEFAAGYQAIDDSWIPSSEPGTYEQAQLALHFMVGRHEDEDWMTSPSILKRSERNQDWVPVHDHAAELLADVLREMSAHFGRVGNNIVQGDDLKVVCLHLARAVAPQHEPKEFD